MEELRQSVQENTRKIDTIGIKFDTFIENDFHGLCKTVERVKKNTSHTNLYVVLASILASTVTLVAAILKFGG